VVNTDAKNRGRRGAYSFGIILPGCLPFLLLAQGQAEKRLAIERLDPLTRAKVLAALVGLIILMLGLMLLASIGARWARNYGNVSRRLPTTQRKSTTHVDDWASRPRPSSTTRTQDEPPT